MILSSVHAAAGSVNKDWVGAVLLKYKTWLRRQWLVLLGASDVEGPAAADATAVLQPLQHQQLLCRYLVKTCQNLVETRAGLCYTWM